MARGEYKLRVQTAASALFAEVSVEVAPKGAPDVPPDGPAARWVEGWASGARSGAEAACRALGLVDVDVRVQDLRGMHVDTTVAAMAAAGFCAVLDAQTVTAPTPRDVAAWHREHGFGLDETPTAAQLVELLQR